MRALLSHFKGLSIVAVFWGEYTRREPKKWAQDLADLLRMVKTGALKPLVSQRYPLERVADALNAVSARKAIGKIVLIPA